MIEELKALAEKARELDRLDKVVFAHEVIALLPAILSALEAVPVMKEALDFYANTPCNLEFGVVNVCTYDDGDKARQALAALEGAE